MFWKFWYNRKSQSQLSSICTCFYWKHIEEKVFCALSLSSLDSRLGWSLLELFSTSWSARFTPTTLTSATRWMPSRSRLTPTIRFWKSKPAKKSWLTMGVRQWRRRRPRRCWKNKQYVSFLRFFSARGQRTPIPELGLLIHFDNAPQVFTQIHILKMLV